MFFGSTEITSSEPVPNKRYVNDMHTPRTLSEGTFIQGDVNADVEDDGELGALTDVSLNPKRK
jgi:hypothetical protein